MNPAWLVETEGLTRVYSSNRLRVTALADINLQLAPGSFTGVTGASGSGKSTLMNLLGGLDSPSSGRIKVGGRFISDMNETELAPYRRYTVGMIFQSFNIISSYTALDNVAFPLLFADVSRSQREKRAAEMLDKVGLYARRDHRPCELSGGEQQRVAIARALINQPKILLADEPTGNLDSRTARQIVEILGELHQKHGLTVIMISHEESLLRDFANRLIRLRDGRIVERENLR